MAIAFGLSAVGAGLLCFMCGVLLADDVKKLKPFSSRI